MSNKVQQRNSLTGEELLLDDDIMEDEEEQSMNSTKTGEDEEDGGGVGRRHSNHSSSEDGGEHKMISSESDTLEAIKARVREMEEEAEKLKQLQCEVDKQMAGSVGSGMSSAAATTILMSTSGANAATSPTAMSLEEKMEIDARSVYVGNVDYGATAEEVEQHFHGCGSINRVTILCNKFDGHPKGFAYIEFAERESVNTAMAMDESLFRGRLIKVMPKRTNRPGVGEKIRGGPRGRRSRGRGFLSRGRSPYSRRGYRGGSSSFRGSNYFSPY